jgi:RNA polymerase sigma factor (TIGR02999 family)
MKNTEQTIQQLLERSRGGDRAAAASLFSLLHDSLKRVAQSRINMEFGPVSLSATVLLNETYLKLFSGTTPSPENQQHLIGMASNAMRQILVDHARYRKSTKRPQREDRVVLTEVDVEIESDVDLEVLDSALKRLESEDQEQASIVELKFFGGLSIQEIAKVKGISTATVSREWRMARAWLRRELTDS